MSVATDLYMNMSPLPGGLDPTGYCLKSGSTPCWVPQMKNIVDPEESKALQRCPTVWDYMCELKYLQYAWRRGPIVCPRPCKTWHYKVSDNGKSKLARSDEVIGFTAKHAQ